ncbi:MFS transporter [Nocardioides panacis]|uniref:MFS transporter n=1 Tax=Nocardioides panacis TaxID=2849501 RepID=A0A975T336_9ACTN|nr:MFS transporter [Nocardioides panacis]
MHVLVAARAVNRLGAFTLPFLAVTLVRELDATVAQAGYLLAAFGLATLPSRLLGGHLADRIGGRATIVAGLVGTAAAQLLVAAAPGLWVAGVAVVLLGLAFEVYEPPSQALVADVTTEDQRPAAYSLMAGAMAAAGMAAGLLALALAGVGLRWLFVVDAATCLACAVLVGMTIPAGPPVVAARPRASAAWRDRRLLVMLGAGTGFALVYLQITIALPLTLVARELPVAGTGLLLTVSATTIVLAQPLLRPRLLGRLDDFAAMTGGYVLLSVGLFATGYARSLPAFAAAAVLWSLGDLVLLGRAYSVVAALVPAGRRGGYLAAYGTSWGFAAVVAPAVGTGLLTYGGPALLWSSLALLCLLLAAAQPVVRRVVSGGTPPATAGRPAPRPAPPPGRRRRAAPSTRGSG